MMEPLIALVCIDLQRGRLNGADAERTARGCIRMLQAARRRGWPVLHSCRRQPGLEGGRPIPGLEPWSSEAVYLRDAPSAFSNPAFRAAALGLGGPFALIGYSLADSVLATAFAAAELHLPVEVLADAVAVGADDDDEVVRQTLYLPLARLAPMARLVTIHDILQPEAAHPIAANLA